MEQEPSTLPESQQLDAIKTQIDGFRSLVLYSGGLLTCLLAALLMRTRRT